MYRGGLFSIIIHIETDVRTIVKGGAFMDNKYVKVHTTGCNAPLKVTPGHFATNHAHINYYLDMTTLKTRLSEAQEIARSFPAAVRQKDIQYNRIGFTPA